MGRIVEQLREQRASLDLGDDGSCAVPGVDRRAGLAAFFRLDDHLLDQVDLGVDRFGRIDTLVNNAGVFVAKPFTDYTDEDYALLTGVNLAGFFHLTRRVVPHMLANGGGHIVTITTSFVDQPNSNVPSVLASLTKGGLSSATKSLAIEYASRGVRVNAIAPGIIKTPMHPVEYHETFAALHPMGRMGETSDIVDAVVYLESAPFVTGEILHVDGGQNAGN
ncbi:SDR family NAD(P)-dependent oxidoreductase [Micromonospora avicenniae]|uniref:SDR family NAD(P)-dependent oxidoreductase n=1 Tax=Micromonospora avicenniae TaxID=1198245 RepID=UPI0033203C82